MTIVKSTPSEALTAAEPDWAALTRNLEAPPEAGELTTSKVGPGPAQPLPAPQPRMPGRPGSASLSLGLGAAAIIGGSVSLLLRQVASWDPGVERHRRRDGRFRRWW